jgi:hypothetical protein
MLGGEKTVSNAYKAPFGQFLFNRQKKALEIFGKTDYYDPTTNDFAFGDSAFNIRDVYQYYYSAVSRFLNSKCF